ncbi:hypothetical protein EDB19DRAFT_1825399 [Suillus lakei]|nr:hypothetical protein EDB19DRAFT_1825399 [Suillus lakei]
MDGQAQHTQETGDMYYGQVYSTPAALGIMHEKAKHYITISQMLQATYGLSVTDESWQDIVARFLLFLTCKYHHYAFSVARQTIMQQYGLWGDASEIKTTVQTVLEDAPYIKSHIAVFTSEISDTTLIQVSSGVLFGPNTLENFSTPPLSGYLPADIAHSVAFIILAIEEWADGTLQPVQLAQSPASIHLEELHTAAEKIMHKLKSSNVKGWIKLSTDIHAQGSHGLCKAWDPWKKMWIQIIVWNLQEEQLNLTIKIIWPGRGCALLGWSPASAIIVKLQSTYTIESERGNWNKYEFGKELHFTGIKLFTMIGSYTVNCMR